MKLLLLLLIASNFASDEKTEIANVEAENAPRNVPKGQRFLQFLETLAHALYMILPLNIVGAKLYLPILTYLIAAKSDKIWLQKIVNSNVSAVIACAVFIFFQMNWIVWGSTAHYSYPLVSLTAIHTVLPFLILPILCWRHSNRKQMLAKISFAYLIMGYFLYEFPVSDEKTFAEIAADRGELPTTIGGLLMAAAAEELLKMSAGVFSISMFATTEERVLMGFGSGLIFDLMEQNAYFRSDLTKSLIKSQADFWLSLWTRSFFLHSLFCSLSSRSFLGFLSAIVLHTSLNSYFLWLVDGDWTASPQNGLAHCLFAETILSGFILLILTKFKPKNKYWLSKKF